MVSSIGTMQFVTGGPFDRFLHNAGTFHCLCDRDVYLLQSLGAGGRFFQDTITSTELHSVSVLLIAVSIWSSRWPSVCASDVLYCVASQHSSYLVWGDQAETSNTSAWQTSPSVYLLSHFMWTV